MANEKKQRKPQEQSLGEVANPHVVVPTDVPLTRPPATTPPAVVIQNAPRARWLDIPVDPVGMCKILKINPKTLARAMQRDPNIPAFKIGGGTRFIPADVLSYLKSKYKTKGSSGTES